jgi:transcriptional regulator with XRE-family HTH domain
VADRRPGPALRRRKLVKELIAARTAAGMNAARLAAAIDLRPSAVSKIEKGTQGLNARNVRAYARATGLSDAKTRELLLLTEGDETRDDWFGEFRTNVPDWMALYAELEQDAAQIWNYEPELVHGLAQTMDYAGALVRATNPGIGQREAHRLLDAIMARQEAFEREESRELHLVLNEAVIRRPVGDGGVLTRQIRHLLALSEHDGVTIRVLPFGAGAHPGMRAGFTLLRFPRGFEDMDRVYLESETGGQWQDNPEHVARYDEAFGRLQLMALDPADTRALLTSRL